MCYHCSIAMRRVSNVARNAAHPYYRIVRMTEHVCTTPPPPIAGYLPTSIGPPTYTHYHQPTPSLDRHLAYDGRARYRNTEVVGRGGGEVEVITYYFVQTYQNVCIQPMPIYSDQRYTLMPIQRQSTGYTIPSILPEEEPVQDITEDTMKPPLTKGEKLKVLDQAFGNRYVDDYLLHELTAVFWDIATMEVLSANDKEFNCILYLKSDAYCIARY